MSSDLGDIRYSDSQRTPPSESYIGYSLNKSCTSTDNCRFVKWVAISHKWNVITGGFLSQTTEKWSKEVGDHQLWCLKWNIPATETRYITTYAIKWVILPEIHLWAAIAKHFPSFTDNDVVTFALSVAHIPFCLEDFRWASSPLDEAPQPSGGYVL